jgi:Protein of unknown function (DUF3237)
MTPSADMPLPPLRSRIVCRVDARLEAPLEWAPTAAGQRRVIGIAGGSFDGPLMSGEILPGGADWQILQPDGTALVTARYTLRTHEGELLLADSRGVRTGPREVLDALRRGEPRDPDEYYFRTAVMLEAGPGDYEWVNRALFVAVAARGPASVVYDLHQII